MYKCFCPTKDCKSKKSLVDFLDTFCITAFFYLSLFKTRNMVRIFYLLLNNFLLSVVLFVGFILILFMDVLGSERMWKVCTWLRFLPDSVFQRSNRRIIMFFRVMWHYVWCSIWINTRLTVRRLHVPKWTSSALGGFVPPKKELSWRRRSFAWGRRSSSEVCETLSLLWCPSH